MKKIVGILAAAAVLATSVFAADVSALVKLDGELLKVAGENITAVNIGHATDEAWNPVLKMAVSGDNYGAETSFYVGNWDTIGSWNKGYKLGAKTFKIWFKPVDVLKIQVGNVDAGTFNETIGYSKMKNYDGWGYQVEFASSGFTLNVGLHTETPAQNWLYKDTANKIKIRGIGARLGYAADFGELMAFFNYQGAGYTADATKPNATNDLIDIAAGYKNKFGDLGLFFDAALEMFTPAAGGEATIGIYADFDAAYAKDALSAEAYAQFQMKDVKATTNPIALKTIAKISYKLDPCSIYAQFSDDNLLANTFKSEIKFGATGSVGAATWDVAAKIETDTSTTFSVPVMFKVAF